VEGPRLPERRRVLLDNLRRRTAASAEYVLAAPHRSDDVARPPLWPRFAARFVVVWRMTCPGAVKASFPWPPRSDSARVSVSDCCSGRRGRRCRTHVFAPRGGILQARPRRCCETRARSMVIGSHRMFQAVGRKTRTDPPTVCEVCVVVTPGRFPS